MTINNKKLYDKLRERDPEERKLFSFFFPWFSFAPGITNYVADTVCQRPEVRVKRQGLLDCGKLNFTLKNWEACEGF